MRGTVLDAGHMKIKINMHFFSLWHKIISYTRKIFDDVQNIETKPADAVSRIFDINIWMAVVRWKIHIHGSYLGKIRKNGRPSTSFAKEQVSQYVIKT